MLSRMKRVLIAASAALLLTGASGAAFAQDRAAAPVATPLVWHDQGNASLDTKVDWRGNRSNWRSDRHDNGRRDNWRHDRRDWRGHGWEGRRDWRRDRWREHRGWHHNRGWGWGWQ